MSTDMNPVSGSETAHLFPPTATSSASTYLRRTWELRHFISASARGKLAARNEGMILGNLWLILEPLMFVMVYYVIFELVLDVSRGTEHFFLFLTVGRLVFGHHKTAVLGAAQSLADHPALVRESNMPKAVLPIGSVVAAFYQWRFELAIIVVVSAAVGVFPRMIWILLLPLSFGLFLLNTGIGLLLAPIVALYTDLKRALPVLFRLMFYGTGVMFPIEAFVQELEHSNWAWAALMANPVYGYVKAFQWVVFGYDVGHPGLATAVSVIWTVMLLCGGFWLFARSEQRIGAFRYQIKG